MPLSIHFSLDSLRLGRSINGRLSSLRKTFSRISTGIRMSSAADDAAGLQISHRIEAQVREAQKEIDGANQKASLLQTLDGALAQSEERLLRMRTLAVQAANGTQTFMDRETLNSELSSMMEELREISEQASFNQIKLLEADEPLMFSVDDEPAQKLLSISSVRPEHLARQSAKTSMRRGLFLDPIDSGEVSINGVGIRATSEADDSLSYSHKAGSAIAKAKAINASSSHTGVHAWVNENHIRAAGAMSSIDLDRDSWFKINGVQINGSQVSAHDGGRALVRAINEAFAQTGVKAWVDREGHLNLEAPDGRNITIEYSGSDTREALLIVDTNGDPINLGDSVEAAVYSHQGDIIEIDIDSQGTYDRTVGAKGSYEVGGVLYQDTSGSHLGQTDYADYVLEVVKPGPVGVATYRIKREDLAVGTIDEEPETGFLNPTGLITSSDPSRLSVHSDSHYDSASDRQYRVLVLEAGDPNTATLGARPLVRVFEKNLSSGDEQELLIGDFRVDENSQIDLGRGVKLDVNKSQGHYVEQPAGRQFYTNGGFGLTDASAERTFTAEGHDYYHNLALRSWNGAHSTEFTFEVTKSGHAYGNRLSSFLDDRAEIKVTAYQPSTDQTYETSLPLYNGDAIFKFNGLGYNLRWPHSYASARSSNISHLGYIPSVAVSRGYIYVGEEKREYVLTASEDSIITPDQPAEFTLDIYEFDPTTGVKSLIQSTNEEYLSYTTYGLGITIDDQGAVDRSEFDGIYLRIHLDSLSVSEGASSGTPDGTVVFEEGDYDQFESHVGVMEVTRGGDAGGNAQFKYYYQDDPDTLIDSGDLQESALLADGIKYSANNANLPAVVNLSELQGFSYTGGLVSDAYRGDRRGEFVLSVSHDDSQDVTLTQTQGSQAHFSLSGDQYDGYFDGDYRLSFRENLETEAQDDYVLDVDFTINLNSEATRSFTFVEDTDIEIGHGLKVRFDSPVDGDGFSSIDQDTVFEGTLTANNYFGLLEWDYEDGVNPAAKIVELAVDQPTDLGHDLSFQVTDLQKGMRFNGVVDPKTFDQGDQWTFKISANGFRQGDYFSITHNPVDLVEGTTWKVNAYNPSEWLKDEEIIITAQNNYEGDEQLLTQRVDFIDESGQEAMGTLEFNGQGEFAAGDQIKVKTRAFMGEVESSGVYTFSHFPTSYEFTVTQGGAIGEAQIAWARADGRTDTEHGGAGLVAQGAPLSADQEYYIEEGIRISLKDVLNAQGQSIAHLAQGDRFSIATGKQLNYTFAGQIDLRSEDSIKIEYSDAELDNALGRMTFTGSVGEANEAGGEDKSLVAGVLGRSLNHSLASSSLRTQSAIRETLYNLDLSLKQISENRATVGAAMNAVERRVMTLSQKTLDLLGVQMRLQGADLAQEVAQRAADQIQLDLAPVLLKSSNQSALMILNLVNQEV